ncbi:MAG: lysylphosphatidylglycerol synthase transmembrane domain-containing protein [Bdellovibrionota bacterium]
MFESKFFKILLKFFKSRSFKIILSILISAGLICWIYKTTDWKEVWKSFLAVKERWFYILPAIALFLFHYVLRALRWEYLLGVYTSFIARFNAIQFGNFTTYLLPLRAGEFLRPLYLCKKTKLTYPSTFVSIVTERFFDLIMALLCFAGMILVLDVRKDSYIYKGVPILGLLALFIFIFIILAVFNDKLLLKLFSLFRKVCPESIYLKLEEIVAEVISGVKPLKNIKNFIMTTIYSVLVWIFTIAYYYAFLFLFFDVPSLQLALAIVVFIAFAVAAPSAPGFIGVFQVACVAAFDLCGGQKEIAVTYSIIAHMVHYFVFVTYGVCLLAKNGMSLFDKKGYIKAKES